MNAERNRIFSLGDFNKRNLSIHPEDHQRSLASPVYRPRKGNSGNDSFMGDHSITSNPTRANYGRRVFSPVENRRPKLKSKNQILEIRQSSLASKIINKSIRSKPSSPSAKPKILNFTSVGSKFGSGKKINMLEKAKSNISTSSSPKESVFSQERLNKFIQNIKKKKNFR